MLIVQSHTWNWQVGGAYGIVHGTPDWRVFQNRLLGPWIVQGLATVTKESFQSAYTAVFSLFLDLATVLCFLIVRNVTNITTTALAAAAVFAAAVVIIQDQLAFSIWDAIDLSTMLVFSYAVFYRPNSLAVLIPVFFVELLNRESAGFIALWIVLGCLFKPDAAGLTPSWKGLVSPRALLGLALAAGGVWWTRYIRQKLFLHSNNPQVGMDQQHGQNGEQLMLWHNLSNFTNSEDARDFLVALMCCGGIYYLSHRYVARSGFASTPFVILISAMVGSVWVFGRVIETRVWLEFIPFCVLLALQLQRGRDTQVVS